MTRTPSRKELECEGFTTTYISPITTKNKKPVKSFLVEFKRVGSYANLYHMTSYMYFRLQFSSFNAHPGPPQCYYCQRYGHSPSRCIKGRCGSCEVTRPTPTTWVITLQLSRRPLRSSGIMTAPLSLFKLRYAVGWRQFALPPHHLGLRP